MQFHHGRSDATGPDEVRSSSRWLNERSAGLSLLIIVCALAWAGVLAAILGSRSLSVTAPNYLIGAPVLTVLLATYWRGWDAARYVAVLSLSILLASTAPLPPAGFPYVPQGFVLPSALATLLAGPRWVVGSAGIMILIVLIRAGGIPEGVTPQNTVSLVITIACLAVTRLVLETVAQQSEARSQ